MGNSVSMAEEEREEAEQQIAQMLQVLENKRDEFLAQVKLTRGEGTDTSKEVQGGRTITRVSDIRVATSAGPSDQLKAGLNTFFEVVQGGDKAKAAAVEGAQQLLSTGLDAIFGARAGQGKQKVGFVILFVNYAFVRVDYLVYAYTASGSKWGAESSTSGACYVADLAVLPLEALRSTEIDYLLAQSLTLPAESSDEEFQAIQRLKIQLVQSKVLSALLEQDGLTLEDLANYAEALVGTEKAIREAFNSLKDFDGDFILPASASTNTTNPVSTITGTTNPVTPSATDTTDDL
jgi:hypothetical protein